MPDVSLEPRTPQRRRILTGLLAVAALTACGSSTGVKVNEIVGTFSLITLNGRLLPVTDSAGNHVESGSVTLNVDGTYVFSESVSLTGVNTNGAYAVSGNSITFTPTTVGGHAATGAFETTTFLTLTMKVAGQGTFILTKNLN